MNVLLVTGSRSFATNIPAHAAFVEILSPLVERIDGLLVGDAWGPDSFAVKLAQQHGKNYVRYCLDGNTIESQALADGTYRVTGQPWWKPNDPRPPAHRWPLVRNRRMVELLSQLKLEDEVISRIGRCDPLVRVLCVGFIDPDARTHGTDHTLGLARRAGIWTARYVWRSECFVEES